MRRKFNVAEMARHDDAGELIEKVCLVCREWVAVEGFNRGHGHGGRDSRCRSCANVRSRSRSDRATVARLAIAEMTNGFRPTSNGLGLIQTDELAAKVLSYWGIPNGRIITSGKKSTNAIYAWDGFEYAGVCLPGGSIVSSSAREGNQPNVVTLMSAVDEVNNFWRTSGYHAIAAEKRDGQIYITMMEGLTGRKGEGHRGNWLNGQDAINGGPTGVPLTLEMFTPSEHQSIYSYCPVNIAGLRKIGEGRPKRYVGQHVSACDKMSIRSKGYAKVAEALLQRPYVECCNEPLEPGVFGKIAVGKSLSSGETEVFRVERDRVLRGMEELVWLIDMLPEVPDQESFEHYVELTRTVARTLARNSRELHRQRELSTS